VFAANAVLRVARSPAVARRLGYYVWLDPAGPSILAGQEAFPMRVTALGLWSCAVLVGGCTAQGLYEPEYLAPVGPTYLAETKIVVLMHDHDQQYTFEGKPTSRVGENITLTMPLGSILREVTADVFQSYFMYGVVFTEELSPNLLYTISLEPEIRNFSYSYERHLEGDVIDVRRTDDGLEAEPVSIITPTIQFELNVTVRDSSENVLLRKVYASGAVAGESYIVTSRPHERINATFHRALQDIMLQVADDIRPFLADEEIN